MTSTKAAPRSAAVAQIPTPTPPAPTATQMASRREAATAWGRQVIAAALRRLQPKLAADCRLLGCQVERCAGRWTVRLTCVVAPAAGAPALSVGGTGRAVAGPDWVAGDLRLARRLELAVAEAMAAVAETSGRGLAMFRRRSSSCGPAPPAGPAHPTAGCRCGSARR